jgi:DNA-binding response OmpR family regulator
MQKPSSQRRILVVDDNHDAAELLQILLQAEGYEVRIAFDGATGLTEASVFHAHVICLDQHMPFLSGTELAVVLRKTEHSRDAHLIAMTGLDDDQTHLNITAAGFNACFCKPFNFEQFLLHLKSYFEQISTTRQKTCLSPRKPTQF